MCGKNRYRIAGYDKNLNKVLGNFIILVSILDEYYEPQRILEG